MNDEKRITPLEAQEKFSKSFYNQIWSLLGKKKDRSRPSERGIAQSESEKKFRTASFPDS
jgi:hypothetical protein